MAKDNTQISIFDLNLENKTNDVLKGIKNRYQSIKNASLEEVFNIFNNLNLDKSHFVSKDDICTPMECVKQMVDYIPNEFWKRKRIKILDPCCGNGNFGAYCRFKTNDNNIWYNDLNINRLANCRDLLNPKHLLNEDALCLNMKNQFDLVIANPPYSGGGNKNQSISNKFIEQSIKLVKNKGYICFITPNNWMTFNNNNTTLKSLLSCGSFVVIDNNVKKYFPQIGSSFTVFVWQKGIFDNKTKVINSYLKKDIQENVIIPKSMQFLPLYLSNEVISIVLKMVNGDNGKFKYRCDLHNFTQKSKLSDKKDEIYRYETIHTVKKTRYANEKQDIYNKWLIIIPLSTYFVPFIRNKVNVTQSVGYIAFNYKKEATDYLNLLKRPEYKVIIHLTRYGNFNNIMLLKHLKFENNYKFTDKEIQIINELYNLIKY